MGKLGDSIRRGASAPLRALMPRNPWLRFLVFALPVLILLSFLEPVVNMLARGVELVIGVFQPLLETTVGRVFLMLLMVTAVVLVASLALRGRLRVLRGRLVLGRHLRAVASLLGDERRRAREDLRKVARYRGPLPPEYGALLPDANLKLARLALERGRVNEALAWLARVVEKGLPRELARSLAQLRADALWQQGEVLPETLEADVRQSIRRFADDYQLHRLLRRVLHDRQAWDEMASIQEKVNKLAPPARKPEERQLLLQDLTRAGEMALANGDLEAARRLSVRMRSADRNAPAAGCLLGKVHLAQGDTRAAIVQWGATRSPEGLDLVASLLRERPGIMDPRELLECCPMQGTLLLVAREFARQGDVERAERAARRAAQVLGPTPTVAAILAEVLQLIGREREASLLCEEAVLRLLAPEQDAG